MFNLQHVLAAAAPAVQQNLDRMHQSGQYILGAQTEDFERELAHAMGAAEAVGVGSGTAALELCLRQAGITKPQAEVIVPSMTSLFTAQAVLAAGASLRLADVSPESLLLTPETLAAAWTPATRAVIAVHLYGQPCDLAPIAEFCRLRGAVLIQDACQAHGALSQGTPLTAFSPYTAYSFYPTKNLGALGDAGAIVTSDPSIAAQLRVLRDGGRRNDQLCRMPALNSRLDEIQACYLRAFLPLLESGNQHRRRLAGFYREALADHPHIRTVFWNSDSVHHLFVIRTPHRDSLRRHLDAHGIQTAIHYPVPLHKQPGLQAHASYSAEPVEAAHAASEILSLPIGPHIHPEQAKAVVDAIREFAP